MHRFVLVATLVALLLVSVPAQARTGDGLPSLEGEFGVLRIEVGPDAMLFHMDEFRLDGETARQLRGSMDHMMGIGDGDGVVSEEERRAFEAFMLASLNAAVPNHFDLDIATIDGKGPFRAEERPVVQLRSLKLTGAEGPVATTASIHVDFTILAHFESVEQGFAAHTVRFENIWGDLTGWEDHDAPPVEIRLSGYNTWTVDASTVTPAALRERLDGDTFVFTNDDLRYFAQEGSGLEFVIRGDPNDRILSDAEEAPAAPIVALLLLGLAGVAGLRRRR